MTVSPYEYAKPGLVNIDQPKYDQSTYTGRARHFFSITNPLNILTSNAELERCACIVKKYRNGEQLPNCITVEQLWRAKQLYDSAYHPDTGEKMNIIGRMSAQVPMNTLITGGMMVFYKGTFNTIFWQWLNQSFNALVNYTNRSGNAKISDKQLMTSYLCATTGAVTTALTLNHLAKKAPPIVARLVPFAAVAAANMINIPCMRAQELKDGLLVVDDKDRPIGHSQIAAQKAISAVTFSRIFMGLPGMVLTPFAMNYLEKRGTLCRYPWITIPVQCGLLAICLTFATPMCCAFFKQKSEIEVCKLEPELQERIRCLPNNLKVVYYNKGL